VCVGFPSVGKSTLLTKLTGTASEAAAYEFTTLTAIPGITRYNGARLQMLDLPGIIEGAADGKGRGRQVISTARTSDLVLIILDVLKPITHKLLIERELEGFGIRLNKLPPKLTVRRKDKGGINFMSYVNKSRLNKDEVMAVCSEYKIHNADIEVCKLACMLASILTLKCIALCGLGLHLMHASGGSKTSVHVACACLFASLLSNSA
jgi:small GTP-binding protein